MAERRLAAARGADQSHVLPGCNFQVDVFEHIFLIRRISETGVLEGNIALDIRDGQSIRGVVVFHRDVHHFKEPLNARDAPLELLHKFDDAADCREQHADIQQIGCEIPGVNFPGFEEERAGYHDCDIHQPIEKAGSGGKPAHIEIGAALDA